MFKNINIFNKNKPIQGVFILIRLLFITAVINYIVSLFLITYTFLYKNPDLTRELFDNTSKIMKTNQETQPEYNHLNNSLIDDSNENLFDNAVYMFFFKTPTINPIYESFFMYYNISIYFLFTIVCMLMASHPYYSNPNNDWL